MSGHLHRFFTIKLSPEYLHTQLAAVGAALKPAIRDFLDNPERASAVVNVVDMPIHLLNYRLYLLDPPVESAAQDVWFQSKVIEILSHVFFVPDAQTELLGDRHKRVNRDRCERARFLLERDLENPPSLRMLAKEVQCSPFYLSRIFVRTPDGYSTVFAYQTVGKGGELLRSGRMTITEVAMKVGYASVSSFNKAFVEYFGCGPAFTLMRRT